MPSLRDSLNQVLFPRHYRAGLSCSAASRLQPFYCTVNVTPCECAMLPSVAVTVTVNVPSVVGVRICTVAEFDFPASACEVAVPLTANGCGPVAGPVYRPFPSIVPPPGETAQFTAAFPAFWTVAVNCCCCGGHPLAPATLGYKLTGVGLTAMLTAGIATCAVAERVVSAVEIALIVALAGVDPEVGAVYIPFPSIVPSAPDPDTDQVTGSEAENCLLPPSATFALVGVIVIDGGGGCEFELTD